MGKVIHRQLFVPLPLLRAIEQLPESIEADGHTLRFTGQVTSPPILRNFDAHRAFVECNGFGGCVDLSSASTARTDMALRIGGLRQRTVEKLIQGLRTAMLDGETPVVTVVDDRIAVCRTA
jgi:hypothetical protein